MVDFNSLPSNAQPKVYEKQSAKALMNKITVCEEVYVYTKVSEHISSYLRVMKTDMLNKLRYLFKNKPYAEDVEKFNFFTLGNAVYIN